MCMKSFRLKIPSESTASLTAMQAPACLEEFLSVHDA